MRIWNEHKKTVAVLAVLLVCGLVWTLTAGDLNPPGAPTGTMRTLNEIYAAAFQPVRVPGADYTFGDVFLSLSGIPGESTDSNHPHWIELYGYTLHVENGAAFKEAPCPKFSNVLISKRTDSASVPLMLKCCDNTLIDQVVIERAKPTNDKTVFYRLTLTNARVTYIAPVSAETPLAEIVSFGHFESIKWEYRPFGLNGEPGEWQVQEWHLPKDGGES